MAGRLGLAFVLIMFASAAYAVDWNEEWGVGADKPGFEGDLTEGENMGAAPGMTSCTSKVGCKECGVSDTTGKVDCYTATEKSGNCKCTLTSGNCSVEGTCTYKR